MSQYSSVQVEIDTHCKFWGFLWIIYNICSEDICFILLIDLGLNGESLHVWFFFFYVCTSSMYFLFLPSVPSTKMWKPFKYNHLGVISVKLHNPFTLSHKVEVSSLAERLWLVELCSIKVFCFFSSKCCLQCHHSTATEDRIPSLTRVPSSLPLFCSSYPFRLYCHIKQLWRNPAMALESPSAHNHPAHS